MNSGTDHVGHYIKGIKKPDMLVLQLQIKLLL